MSTIKRHPKVVVEELRLRQALCLRGLPDGYLIPYTGVLPNGVTFAIFHPREDWDYTDFRLVVGDNEGGVREVTVLKVVRYRDDGTTDISTPIGNFHFPSYFNKDDKATFDGQPISVEDH